MKLFNVFYIIYDFINISYIIGQKLLIYLIYISQSNTHLAEYY